MVNFLNFDVNQVLEVLDIPQLVLIGVVALPLQLHQVFGLLFTVNVAHARQPVENGRNVSFVALVVKLHFLFYKL